ncbi:hypothetical protein N9L68_00885 [bacterium]|nr:hypothetical protein [bacterium]
MCHDVDTESHLPDIARVAFPREGNHMFVRGQGNIISILINERPPCALQVQKQ